MTSPEPAPRYRRAEDAEAERVAAIAHAAYSVYPARIGVRPRPLDDDYAALVAARTVWVEDGPPLDAFVVLEEHPDHLWVDNVAVDPPRQGSGLGRALLAFAERRARELGLSELRLLTSVRMVENIALYRRLGYVDDLERSDAGGELLRMRKQLADDARAPARTPSL